MNRRLRIKAATLLMALAMAVSGCGSAAGSSTETAVEDITENADSTETSSGDSSALESAAESAAAAGFDIDTYIGFSPDYFWELMNKMAEKLDGGYSIRHKEDSYITCGLYKDDEYTGVTYNLCTLENGITSPTLLEEGAEDYEGITVMGTKDAEDDFSIMALLAALSADSEMDAEDGIEFVKDVIKNGTASTGREYASFYTQSGYYFFVVCSIEESE